MATIGQLVKAMAAVSRLDESTVKLIARYARECGYLGQQSTGAGAAKMTSTDAANLLIALNASELAKNIEHVLPVYTSIESWGSDDIWTPSEESFLTDTAIYKACAPGVTFSQALSNLIELGGSQEGNISDLQKGLNIFKSSNEDRVWLDIVIARPNPLARIEVKRLNSSIHKNPYRLETTLCMEFARKIETPINIGDRIAEYKCTNITLQELAKCVFS